MKLHHAVILAVAIASIGSTRAATTIVYVGNSDSNEIHVMRLDRSSGELTLVERTPIPNIVKSGGSTPLTISPDKRLLFAATRGEPQAVSTFNIDQATGKLKYAGRGPLADSMPYISTDRTGKFLFAASYPGHKLTVSAIGPDGVIKPPHQILEGHTNAHSIMTDPANRFVLAATLGNNFLNVFTWDSKAGELKPHDPAKLFIKDKAGPRHFVFHPNRKTVYLLGELDAHVHVLDYDASLGSLKLRQSVNALPTGVTGRIAAADIHITPDAKFVYASDRTSNTITGFRVDPKLGTLTLIESIPTEQMPRSFAIDSASRFLFLVGMKSNHMSGYRIEAATGKLILLKQYEMGKTPNWVEILDLP
jgi:6-phosphogluconolactonase